MILISNPLPTGAARPVQHPSYLVNISDRVPASGGREAVENN